MISKGSSQLEFLQEININDIPKNEIREVQNKVESVWKSKIPELFKE